VYPAHKNSDSILNVFETVFKATYSQATPNNHRRYSPRPQHSRAHLLASKQTQLIFSLSVFLIFGDRHGRFV